MKNLILNMAILFGLITFTSCDDKFNAGPMDTETRDLETFNEIIVEGSMTVLYTHSDKHEATVEAGELVIPDVETEVVNNKLIIREKSNKYVSKNITIYVKGIELVAASLDGSGDLEIDETDVDTFHLDLEGSGDVSIKLNAVTANTNLDGSGSIYVIGKSTTHNQTLDGSGDFNGRNFESVNCNSEVTGSGDAEVHASNVLNATLVGSGSIKYWGDPTTVNKDLNGSGSIIKK